MGRTAPPAGASICINPITFSPVHGTVLAPIYHTERCLLRSTSRANALTIQNFPTSVRELSSELTVLTFKLSNQITLQQPVDTTAISRIYGAYGSFCWKLRCASNVICSCSLVNLTVLRQICAPQAHPMGFVKSTHPTREVRVRRTLPSRIP